MACIARFVPLVLRMYGKLLYILCQISVVKSLLDLENNEPVCAYAPLPESTPNVYCTNDVD